MSPGSSTESYPAFEGKPRKKPQPVFSSTFAAIMEVLLYDSTYCRLCAEENPSGVLLYSVEDSDADLSALVNRYLPFKIQDDGKLPRTICPGCNIQLQATVQFFDLLVEGQKKIRDMWKSQLEQQRKAERERQKAEKSGVESLLIAPAQDVHASEGEGDGENRIVIQSISPWKRIKEVLLYIAHSVRRFVVPVFVKYFRLFQDSCTVNLKIYIVTLLTSVNMKQFHLTVLSDGTLFSADHEMALKMEGLERPRRKRGRPPKKHIEPSEEKELEKEPESPEASQDPEEMEEDADGRRRRKRKVPQRQVVDIGNDYGTM
ncbi:hypothetical protein ANN_18316 [Periplaneta americana]|uniref:ZAD domain-containing protein n=1 Tax=Periplaneta americana TaxID=6978 RepID=A0ABQ8SNF6_PERAM|nr:hypothetical protein ANN_18316 [Periplaneta americana]